MIVREVLKDPALLAEFDYFNDAKDTIQWLREVGSPVSHALANVLIALDAKYNVATWPRDTSLIRLPLPITLPIYAWHGKYNFNAIDMSDGIEVMLAWAAIMPFPTCLWWPGISEFEWPPSYCIDDLLLFKWDEVPEDDYVNAGVVLDYPAGPEQISDHTVFFDELDDNEWTASEGQLSRCRLVEGGFQIACLIAL